MNTNSSIDFTKRCNENKVTLYCRKCDPDSAHQDQYAANSDDLPPLVVLDSYLYIYNEKSKKEKKIMNIFFVYFV